MVDALGNLAVATVLVETLCRLDPRFPDLPARDSPESGLGNLSAVAGWLPQSADL
jgi:hypothetical protein